jgi:hypothetical protein
MSQITKSDPVPWYLWPFWAIWRFFTWIVSLTGRLIAVLLGLVMLIIGGVLCITVILLPLGIPMIIFGFLLIMRGLF